MHSDSLKPNVIWICVFLVTENIFTTIDALDYKELQDLGVACSPMDTCVNRSYEDLERNHSCGCTHECIGKNNCCIDSPYLDTTMPKATCTKIPQSQETAMIVTHCNHRWSSGTHIKQLCEDSNLLLEDPVEIVPVTNPFSGVTYKNYFCARCNNDQEELVFWDAQTDTTKRNYLEDVSFPRVVRFESDSNQWVYWYRNETENTEYNVPVTLLISKPQHLEQVIPECSYDIESHCTEKWEGTITKKKCEAYTATVKAPWNNEDTVTHLRAFRNIHCAICNDITDFINFRCVPYKESIEQILTSIKPTSSFTSTVTPVTSLFGHLLWDRRCLRENEVYIERLRGCRTIICLNPGHIIRNRRCVSP